MMELQTKQDIRSKLRRSKDVLAKQLEDADFRDEWERTAIARVIALSLIRYRGEHGLSQTELARKLGLKQPAIARLERGDRPVTIETLLRVADGLGISLRLEISPRDSDESKTHLWSLQADRSAGLLKGAIHESVETRHGGRLDIVAT